MSSPAKVIGLGASLPAVIVLVHGCKGPTQVTVDLRTNVVCADTRGIDIVAAADPHRAEERAALLSPGSARFPSATTNDCKEGPAPREVGTLVVTPSGTSGAVVVVSAFGTATLADCTAAHFASQCIVARRRFTFVEGRQLVLPIVLDPECAGVPCNESSTCVGKTCVDSTVECSGDACSEPGVGADGGLVEVDAQPVIDAAPEKDAATAADAGNDGAVTDAGKTDGGNADAGPPPLTCASPKCLAVGSTTAICLPGRACCYTDTTVTCSQTCKPPNLAACCRDAADCDAGQVCCASTAMLQADTRITCRSLQDCGATGGHPVCSDGHDDCGGFGACDHGARYSTVPDFFSCS